MSRLSDLNRLRVILTTVMEAGGGVLVTRLGLRRRVPLSCQVRTFLRPPPAQRCLLPRGGRTLSPAALRETLEKLGPTFIKLGQVLSMRPDLVGEPVSQELAKLQDAAPPFPFAEVSRIVTEELGRPPGELFQRFDEAPVAAASLAQVHRACLKDGTEVAVKVQRPDIRKTVTQDIRVLAYLAGLAARALPELRLYRPQQIIAEFADWTLRELDFREEGTSADRFRHAFRGNCYIVIPRVHWAFTTARVLTEDFIHGVRASDAPAMARLDIDRRTLAQAGANALLKQSLVDGFFHADPHPGNFFVLPGGVLCLYDFGMVGYLTRRERRELAACLLATLDKSTEDFTRHYLHLVRAGEESDLAGFRKDMAGVLNGLFFSPAPPSVAQALMRLLRQGAARGVAVPTSLALFGRAMMTAEVMGRAIDPHFSLNRALRPFVWQLWLAYFSPESLLRSLRTNLFDYQELLEALPEHVEGILGQLERGELSIRLNTRELRSLWREFDAQTELRLLGLGVAGAFFLLFILLTLEGRTVFGLPLSGVLFLVIVVLLIWYAARRQGHHHRLPPAGPGEGLHGN